MVKIFIYTLKTKNQVFTQPDVPNLRFGWRWRFGLVAIEAPDGFWFFYTGAKEQSCHIKLYAKKQLRSFRLKFLFIPLKLKTEFSHSLTAPDGLLTQNRTVSAERIVFYIYFAVDPCL